MPGVEGYRRVRLSRVYINLARMLDDYHGASELCARLRSSAAITELSDGDVAATAKRLLTDVDEQLAPFDRDERLYRILRWRDELERLSKVWDTRRVLTAKFEEVRSAAGMIYGYLEPEGYRSGLAITSYTTDAERATALTDYVIDLLATALLYPERIDAVATENLCSQLHEIAELADRQLVGEGGRELLATLCRGADELEVLSLLEFAAIEVVG